MRALANKKAEFDALGATLIALTPELPDYASTTIDKNEVSFPVLTDLKLEVAEKYGLVFELNELRAVYEQRRSLTDYYGEGNANRLPLSATYVIDQKGIITYAFLDANYRYRAEPTRLVEALKHLRGEASPEHLVLQFWENTWNPPYDLNLIDRLMTDDFTITSAGKDVAGRENFKTWVAGFQKKIGDLRLEEKDTFASADGSKVTSRWIARGKNRGLFDLPADDREIEFSGIALWEITDGKLSHNWVERSAWELHQKLSQ